MNQSNDIFAQNKDRIVLLILSALYKKSYEKLKDKKWVHIALLLIVAFYDKEDMTIIKIWLDVIYSIEIFSY